MCCLIPLLLVLCLQSLLVASPPNVVVILTDDQGWGDLSCHGNTNLRTPRIDSLARDGALFERFYVCPVCSPTRAEFLTGRYHLKGGVVNVSTGGERLDLDERTIADFFKGAGYSTGMFGKWHNGIQYPYHPTGRGFDEFYGFCSGHWGDYFSPPLDHNGQIVQGQGFMADDLTSHAIDYIKQQQGRPFFCYLALNTPHSPMQVPDPYWERFKDLDPQLKATNPAQENLPMTRAALAMVENIDDNVGRLLDALNEQKLADNTIVAFFCDNGPNSFRWNGGMKGRKGQTDEGGVRSPLLVRWPGKISAGRRVEPIAGAIDLLPTLADLAGVAIPQDRPLDGISVKPLLMEPTPTNWPDRMIFSHWNNQVSVRSQQYLLDAAGKLYDMQADPGQTRDVSAQLPEIHSRMTSALATWRADHPRGVDDRPYPIGYRESPLAQLPARDGVPHGGVQRSAKAPNCSYFTNWTKPEDSITWDIEVHTPGTYVVEVQYTCPAADVGSEIEVSFGDQSFTAKITEPHDPPARGNENDRVTREGESLVKDFRRLRLGEFTLPAARGPLKLRALSIPGQQVMEVRGLLVTLQ